MCPAQTGLCKKIIKEVDRKKAITTYKSPRMKHITAIREFKTDEFFGLLIYLDYEKELTNPRGITLTFSDGTTYTEDASIDCRQAGAIVGFSAKPMGYFLQGFIHIKPENFNRMSTRRIVNVQLNEAAAQISEKEGDKVKAFVKCLADVKE
jgi:hypothetical protein